MRERLTEASMRWDNGHEPISEWEKGNRAAKNTSNAHERRLAFAGRGGRPRLPPPAGEGANCSAAGVLFLLLHGARNTWPPTWRSRDRVVRRVFSDIFAKVTGPPFDCLRILPKIFRCNGKILQLCSITEIKQ